MRIALLAPLPPEQTGIADYASHLKSALELAGVEVCTPLAGSQNNLRQCELQLSQFDWQNIDLVHAELGGGRLAEFQSLRFLRKQFPQLALTATVHDPERLVWRRERLPWPLSWAEHLPSPWPQAATLLADPVCLHEERQVAHSLNRLITLTQTGSVCLQHKMRLAPDKMKIIAHGNQPIAYAPLPPLQPLRLLYFGFIYRGKGIEDLLDALAITLQNPQLKGRLRLTIAGGSAPEIAFGGGGSYLETLRQRVAQLGLTPYIDWQLDVPSTTIPALIQQHHAMILPYRESKKLSWLGQMRGTSGALSWAVACGRGAITSDARAFAEEVSSGNGAIYPQGDVVALANAIERLAMNPELSECWAKRARILAVERAWPVTAGHFKELFRTTIEEVKNAH